eukprot:SAG11_NODE_319_length_10822_cov_12.319500_6_plen_157_part_00
MPRALETTTLRTFGVGNDEQSREHRAPEPQLGKGMRLIYGGFKITTFASVKPFPRVRWKPNMSNHCARALSLSSVHQSVIFVSNRSLHTSALAHLSLRLSVMRSDPHTICTDWPACRGCRCHRSCVAYTGSAQWLVAPCRFSANACAERGHKHAQI